MTVYAIADQVKAEALNPGCYFGKVYLIEVGCGFTSFPFAVEADCEQDAIDEFADSKYGHHILIEESEYGDYGHRMSKGDMIGDQILEKDSWVNLRGEPVDHELLEPSHCGNEGKPCCLDNITIRRFNCVYHDPDDANCDSIKPELYNDRNEE